VESLVKYILIIFLFSFFPLYLFAVSPEDQAQIDLANSLNEQAVIDYKQGRYAEAETLYKRSLAIEEKILGPEHPDVATKINDLANLYYKQSRLEDAESLYKKSLEIRKKIFGPDHRIVSETLMNLGNIFNLQGRYTETEEAYNRSIEIFEKAEGPDHPDLAIYLGNFGLLYIDQGQYTKAESTLNHSLKIFEKTLGPNHPEVARVLSNLAILNDKWGRFTKAESLMKRSMAIRGKKYGKDHPILADNFNNLSGIYFQQARFAEAESALRKSMAIYKKTFGLDNLDVAMTLRNLGSMKDALGRYAEAEELYKVSLSIIKNVLGTEHPRYAYILGSLSAINSKLGRYIKAESLLMNSLEIIEKTLGTDHPDFAKTLQQVGLLYLEQGRYAEAESLIKRSVQILVNAFGPAHYAVDNALGNLGVLYSSQGRYEEAVKLYMRSLDNKAKTFGNDHPALVNQIANLANTFYNLGRYDDAEEANKIALTILEKHFRAEHPKVISILNSLALIYSDQGHYAEALQIYKRCLNINEEIYGSDSVEVAIVLNNLGKLYTDQAKFAEAEFYQKRSLKIREKAFQSDHPLIALSYYNLARLYFNQKNYKQSLISSRKYIEIYRNRFKSGYGEAKIGLRSEKRTKFHGLFNHIRNIAFAIKESSVTSEAPILSEGFEVAQFANISQTTSTISRLGARFAAGNGQLAKVVRFYQDLFKQREVLDALLLKEQSKTLEKLNEGKVKNLRIQLDSIQNSLNKTREKLEQEFPEYSNLARAKPLSIKDVQHLLSPNEVLLTYVVGNEESYLWVIRPSFGDFFTLPVGEEELTRIVTNLRQALVPQSRLQSFDLEASQSLYKILIKPAEEYIGEADHLIFVPNGPLESLPMGLLVKQLDRIPEQDTGDESVALVTRGLEGVVVEDDSPEEVSTNNRYTSYREAKWLAKEYAITILPSVSSLNALRGGGANVASSAPNSFIGFGDPLLGSVIADNKYVPGSAELFSRGAFADVKEVRQLPRLPETDKELRSIAQTLGAPSDSVYLREDATESKVKSLDLSQSRILAFATHGLVSGEMKGLAEPALVFTPPEVGTEEDDGLLTASEVAQLKLDADWVILSACNTASSDGKPGAEGLSGLARSFFYAGARSLLVSHWPVETNSAVELTTGIFEEMKTNPEIGRAEALRRSRIRLINNKDNPKYAHPYFWAPFVVVGEGGRIQTTD